MHVENVDVRSAQLLERSFDGHVERFGTVPRIVNLMSNIVLTSLEAGRILSRVLTSTKYIKDPSSTLVARTSWSRMPRLSAHSPIKASEVSS